LRELSVARKSAGIDVGSHSVKAVVLSKRGSSVAIRNFMEVCIRRSGPAEPEQVAAAVEELSRRLKVGSALVVSCISTQQATVRNLEIPFSEEEKARQILKFQTEPYLAYPIEEVVIDFYNMQSAAEGRMKVLLAAIHKGVIKSHLELLSRGEIDPEVVDVDFMAVCGAALRAEPRLREGAGIVLDVGASKSIACYVQEGRLLAVRCIPLGGDDFTNAIGREIGVGFEDAERLKTEGVGSAQDERRKAGVAIGSVLERLGAELDRTVRYFSSQVRGGKIDRVVLCGGSASLPGLDKIIREALSAEVTVVSPSDTIRNSSGKEIPFPRFATAVGLALRGVGEALCLQNFRQEEYAYSRPFRRLRKRLAASAALAAGVAALLVFSLVASLDRNRAKRADLNFLVQTKLSTTFPDKRPRDVAQMSALLKEEESVLTPFRELRWNASILEVLDDLSTRISKEMKAEISLFSFIKSRRAQIPVGKGKLTGGAKTPTWVRTITLRGTVSSVTEALDLERILEESPIFADVENRGGTSWTEEGRVRFEFVLRLKEKSS